MKKYMTGIYNELHFVAELRDGKYYCIPNYSGGNGTEITFFTERKQAKFFDNIDDAFGDKLKKIKRDIAKEEENKLCGF